VLTLARLCVLFDSVMTKAGSLEASPGATRLCSELASAEPVQQEAIPPPRWRGSSSVALDGCSRIEDFLALFDEHRRLARRAVGTELGSECGSRVCG